MCKKSRRKSTRHMSNPYWFGCNSFKPGHNVYWIQAMHSANKESVSAQTWPGKVVSVKGEVLTVLKSDGSLARYRCHDPARLVYILEDKGVRVTVNDQYSILRAGLTRRGSLCFSVKADTGQPLGRCPTGDLPLDLAPRSIRRHGGFGVSAD